MEGITVHIGWEYFLGLLGALVAVAWYSNGRFTALETSMDWVKNMLLDLKRSIDDANPKGRGGGQSNDSAKVHEPFKQQTIW
jgi:hypothetical protein